MNLGPAKAGSNQSVPVRMIDVTCPGCGKDRHVFAVPSRPGVYRLSCQADSGRTLRLRVLPDGSVRAETANDADGAYRANRPTR